MACVRHDTCHARCNIHDTYHTACNYPHRCSRDFIEDILGFIFFSTDVQTHFNSISLLRSLPRRAKSLVQYACGVEHRRGSAQGQVGTWQHLAGRRAQGPGGLAPHALCRAEPRRLAPGILNTGGGSSLIQGVGGAAQ